MADFTPSTRVYVLKDVPLDDTYTDTRWFSSASAQAAFFIGKAKKQYSDFSYQRVNNSVAAPRGPLTTRVPDVADTLYDCNYLMFQNHNYGTKWFYAFIKQVNYINPNCTEIVYEIDYLQTFMFDITIQPSFVEREHASAAEDTEFANLTPEPIEVDNWAEDGGSGLYRWDLSSAGVAVGNKIILAIVPNSAIQALIQGVGATYAGIYSGASYWVCNNAGEANTAILALAAVDHADSIVDVFMSPIQPIEGDGAQEYTVRTGINTHNLTFRTPTGTYTARNKKILNSQFTYIRGNSDDGNTMDYKPEFCQQIFGGRVSVAYTAQLSMLFKPAYMGYQGNNAENLDYSIPFTQVIHCTWNSQGYLGSFVKEAAKTVTAIGGAVAAAYTGGAAYLPMTQAALPAGETGLALAGQASKAGQAISAVKNASGNSGQLGEIGSTLQHRGVAARGNQTGDIMAYSMALHGFEFKRMCPPKETLERIDTFFDMFGYAVNKVKAPNLDTRTAWNYVKLKSPCIYGSVPVEGMAEIKKAFERGIRLWHVDAVGNYSIQNPPK